MDGDLLLLKVKEKLFLLEKLREDILTPDIIGLLALLIMN